MLGLPEINNLGLRLWLAQYEDNELNDPDDRLYVTTPIWCLLQPYFDDGCNAPPYWYWLDVEEAAKFDFARAFFDSLKCMFEPVSEYKNTDFDIYHTLYRYTDSKIEVLNLMYNGCSHHGPLNMYFIREV